MKEDFFLEIENDRGPSAVSLEEEEREPTEPRENIIPNERVAFLLFPFFIEMIGQFIDILETHGNHARILQEKLSGKELGAYLSRMITEDTKKVELLQKTLLNYIKISNPIVRTNTVNVLLEEELKKYQVELEGRKVKLFKSLEKDLPETIVPDEQLNYILSCLLQYAGALMHPHGYFGLFTRSLILQKETGEGQGLGKKGEKCVEILMIYMDSKKPTDQVGTASGTPARQKEGVMDLILRLIDEIVRRNRGMMKLEVDEKKAKTTISLRFPVERRKVIYYQPATELNSKVNPHRNTFEKLSSLERMEKRG
ncbi:MAG TPA: hypothetical protein VLK23_19030 [Thermodesulfobacteriota bacterium]|nr:hypothetical protein [Thermodesulfobacteriota bacterium]